MDYNYFDSILNKHGLQSEPAFKDVLVEISPLPSDYQNVLGLYYPDADPAAQVEPGTIWVPSDADEETTLHELGHRVGHFYKNDLSEEFAERYRKGYRKIARAPAQLSQPEDHTARNVLIAAGLIAVSIAVLTRVNPKKTY